MTNSQIAGMLTPTTFEGAVQFSETLASSSMVPKAFQGSPGDILVAVQWGSEVGLPPMQALQNIAVINGKPSIYGDALLALVTAHPEYGGHEEELEGEVATCTIVRVVKGRDVTTARSFSVGDAKRANLFNKPGPWKQYPKRMLAMRARGFAIRDAFPDAIKGVIIREEADDMEPKDITPANPLDAIAEEKSPATDPASEQSLVSDDPIDQNMGDLPPGEPVAPTEEIDPDAAVWEMIMPEDGRVEICQTSEDWFRSFLEIMGMMSDDREHDFVERRHIIGEYKKANDDTIARMEDEAPELHKDLKARYSKMLKYLSAKAKEENG